MNLIEEARMEALNIEAISCGKSKLPQMLWSLTGELERLQAELDKRHEQLHNEIRLHYGEVIDNCWKQEAERLQAENAELRKRCEVHERAE